MEQITTISTTKKVFRVPPAVLLGWFSISSFTAIAVLAVFTVNTINPITTSSSRYSIFSSKPLVLGKTSEQIQSTDARALVLDQVFEYFQCPMAGMGNIFVREADKNNLPYWLVPAIAFQESSCGKRTPEINGVESYNGWGWGVWGENIKFFDNWEHGIEVVSKYMNDQFYSKGITNPCDIMKTYTPPSNGTWCKGVEYFKDIITEFESPSEDLT